jgi:hypothetical protein
MNTGDCLTTDAEATVCLDCFLPTAPKRAKVEIKQASKMLRTIAFIVISIT